METNHSRDNRRRNEYIILRERCKYMIKKPKPKPSSTLYTGLIKSTRDLAFWADQKPFEYHCVKCNRGIEREIKHWNRGFCNDCVTIIIVDKRCMICFEKIVNGGRYELGDVCCICSPTTSLGSNCNGYKEGGKISGGLRTNYWVDNENDNTIKLLEERE